MKIRIGSDIKLRVTLLGTNTIQPVNINSVKAYLINKTVIKEYQLRTTSKTKFLSRYPLEPLVAQYQSTQYNLNASGYPVYHTLPQGHIHATYGGFGVNPCWGDHYTPIPHRNFGEYLAKVKATPRRDVIDVYFPAEALLLTGTYNLVIVAKVYEAGFDDTNIRTVTMDYENIFTLVNSTSDTSDGQQVDSAVTLLINGSQDINEDGNDIYVKSGEVNQSGEIELAFNGSNQTVKIDTKDEFTWGEYE